MHPAHFAGEWIDWNCWATVIDEHLLAGSMSMAQRLLEVLFLKAAELCRRNAYWDIQCSILPKATAE
jgi:hypothetical protein